MYLPLLLMNYKDFPLHDYVTSDENVALVRTVLAGGANPNLEDKRGETPLHAAVKSHEYNPLIVQELIKAGADVDRRGVFRFAPLHYAVMYQNPTAVDAILQSTNRINCRTSTNKTPLHYVVRNVCLGLDTHTLEFSRYNPFSDMRILKKLLDHKHINVNLKDAYGITPLLLAVADKQPEMVKLLLNKDPKLDVSNRNGNTALHIALSREDPCPYTTVLLLLKGASILQLNGNNETPLKILINSQSFKFACTCLKVIAFKYPINELLVNKLQNVPELSQFLNRCWNEIKYMKCDIIAKGLTVFDFFAECAPMSGFEQPILEIYKPIVQRLVTGHYPVYFYYILKRISESKLSAILDIIIAAKYCDAKCDARDCKKEYPTHFSKIIWTRLLNKYISNLDIFCLVSAFTNMNIDDSTLNFREHECYLTDSWGEYPDEHFY